MRTSTAKLWGRLITCAPIVNRRSRTQVRRSPSVWRPPLQGKEASRRISTRHARVRAPRSYATLLLFLCFPLLAQTGGSGAQGTGELKLKAEARLVLVDAVVTGKKDEPVHGLEAKDFHLTPLEKWTRYPIHWRIEVPSLQLQLDCRAVLDDQELKGRTTYWEGAVDYSGSAKGVGYLEMTGYDKPLEF